MNLTQLVRLWSWLRRYPFSVTCSALSVGLIVASWLLWQQVASLNAELAARSQEGDTTLATIVSGTTLRAELAYVQKYTSRIQANLVNEDNLASNKSYFYNIESQSSAHIIDLQQLASPQPDSGSIYKRIPFAVSLTGTYSQVAAFLLAVETGPRISTVTAFRFRRNDPPAPPITLDLGVDLLGKP